MKKLPNLILMRHGESVWNKENVFTGWVDVPLSPQGIQGALKAGSLLEGISLDVVFTSGLCRASHTALLALSTAGGDKIPYMVSPAMIYSKKTKEKLLPVISAWELNERMYGELQGQNKDEARAQFGKEQVEIWRRSFDVAPPGGESLKMTAERTLPYFDREILPRIQQGERVLIAAHGNSLRSIIMELDGLSPEEVVSLEVPLSSPIFYYKEGDALLR